MCGLASHSLEHYTTRHFANIGVWCLLQYAAVTVNRNDPDFVFTSVNGTETTSRTHWIITFSINQICSYISSVCVCSCVWELDPIYALWMLHYWTMNSICTLNAMQIVLFNSITTPATAVAMQLGSRDAINTAIDFFRGSNHLSVEHYHY